MQLKLLKFFLLIFAVIFAGYIVSTSWFVRFWADDFCTAVVHKQHGFWGSQLYWWTSWSGRYSYNLILQYLIVFGEGFVRFVPIIIFLLLTLSGWPIFAKLTTSKDKLFSYLLGTVFTLFILINTPNIIQSFYWFGGTLIYTLPFVFLNLFVSLVAWSDLTNLSAKKMYYIAFLLMFFAGGFSESFIFTQLIFFVLALVIIKLLSVKNERKLINLIIAGGLGLVLSLIVMSLSPGLVARSETLTKPKSIWWVLSMTKWATEVHLVNLFESKPLFYTITIIFCLMFLLTKISKKNILTKLSLLRFLMIEAVILMCPLMVIASLYAVSYYTMAYHPPERAFIITSFSIMTSVISTSYFAGIYLLPKLQKVKLKTINLLLFIIFIFSLFLLMRDTYRKWRFLRNDLKTYADAWDIEKESIVKQALDSDKVSIKNIPPVGRIDGFKDNKGWVTGCAAGYFGVKEFNVE